MQFKSFHWLSYGGIGAITPCSTNMVSVRVIFWAFLFNFSLAVYILGALLIKQLSLLYSWRFFATARPFIG